jgi:Zn-dependent peptidase ImmA (M78 family)
MSLSTQFKEACERTAIERRRKLGNRLAFDPLPSAELLEDLEVQIKSFDEFKILSEDQRRSLDNISAGVVSVNPLVVIYNPSHSPARHESNMMHECGHILLKHPLILIDLSSPTPPRDSKQEEEATYQGGCLQLPKRGLLWAIQKGMDANTIASHFGCSIEMVEYRANMIGQRLRLDSQITRL